MKQEVAAAQIELPAGFAARDPATGLQIWSNDSVGRTSPDRTPVSASRDYAACPIDILLGSLRDRDFGDEDKVGTILGW